MQSMSVPRSSVRIAHPCRVQTCVRRHGFRLAGCHNDHRSVPNTAKVALTFVLICLFRAIPISGQDLSTKATPPLVQAPGQMIVISDEPKTVDPMTLVSPQLGALATVKFDAQPLKEVFTWLQRERSINVWVDYNALASAKILETDPVDEELANAPVYLLLDRLGTSGIAWYELDNSLQITSMKGYLQHETTVPYNLGDLIDAGYSATDLVSMITRCCKDYGTGANGPTEISNTDLIGDVVFVRGTGRIQRETAGLLVAIRSHGRRTFTADAPQHAVLRDRVHQNVSCDFQETPLIFALQELSRQSKIDIRLDRGSLAKSTVRERTPVTLKLTDQKLSAVLRSILSNLGLTWFLQDDVLWVATTDAADQIKKTAVYDVRDLCRDADESAALRAALQKQTQGHWHWGGSNGGVVETPKAGVLVVRQVEAGLDEILRLLENYRFALRSSKVRVEAGLDPQEVVTGYYRLSEPMAGEVQNLIERTIFPETWKSAQRPDAIGSIVKISVKGVLVEPRRNADAGPAEATQSNAFVTDTVVLIIRQSRSAHRAIGKLIQTLMDSKTVDADATRETGNSLLQPNRFGGNLIPSTK